MRRRPLTPEQETARDARRAKFAELVKAIGAMTDEQRAVMAARMGSVVTVEGRVLSVGNQIMLAMQCPSATVVGGFNQWKAAGRYVRKGEHGLMLWAPRMVATEDGSEAIAADGDGRRRFITITVFDISQTEAADASAA